MSQTPRVGPPVLDAYIPERGDGSYVVTHYDLDLDYKVSSNRLSGRATLAVTALRDIDSLTVDLVGLRVQKVSLDGRAARWAHRGSRVRVTLPSRLAAGAAARLAITYAGSPGPARSRWGEVGWEELSDGVLVASQPSGAATWFPCNDHPRHKATYRLTFECDSPYAVVATGALVSTRVRGSRTSRVFEQRHPTASYLVTVHVGQYTRFTLAESPVRQVVVLPAGLERPVRTDLSRQPRMLEVFEDLFGEYPHDDYTVVVTADDLEIPLEAQAMATFGPNWLLGRHREERLVAHELAHQWFGNSLTISSWSDIWLNEGFACYAEWLWSEAAGGPTADGNARTHWARLSRLPQDLVLADPGPDLMFDDRVYKRGALTLHALRIASGDDDFFAMLRTWVDQHRHGTVSTAAFVEHATGHLGADRVEGLLRAWLWSTPLPGLPGRPLR
ncbi:peptidase M1 [Intrasporangium oryzae NRRL B-24470]|uniref:Aminopeptidase N n=1 Tax=Intrasporangium oryzae NRRL B-24470 TaxID=1386089 RepID=W9G8Z4_9MICO|nr:M1 family metallopeptidase [Intrasporangium oryzae]EWT00344.1 peptidase M1 [Intrasporangium oryzae NRRL B-24470]